MCPMREIRHRKVTMDEEKLIIDTIDRSFGMGVANKVLKPGTLVLIENRYKIVYKLSKALLQTVKCLELSFNLLKIPKFHSFGLSVGVFRGEQFLIGIEMIRDLAKYSNKIVEVTAKGEQLFLYGRNLQKRSLNKIPRQLRAGERVIIQNMRKEALGIGELLEDVFNLDTVSPKREVINNLIDLGTRYLRKGY